MKKIPKQEYTAEFKEQAGKHTQAVGIVVATKELGLTRTPRVKLPDGSVQLVKPPFAGELLGFTLLLEALVLMLARQMPFAAVARIVGISAYRVLATCRRYVALALQVANFSQVKALAIDETSRARGHDYITLAADALERRVLALAEGREAKTIATIAAELAEHGCPPEQIESVSIDMSPAFIKGCTEELPNARTTFDKFHVVWHANAAADKMRSIEQRTDKSLKGLRWSLLKDCASLRPEAAADLDALIARMTTVRTARAWVYKEQLREILERKQIHVVRDMLGDVPPIVGTLGGGVSHLTRPSSLHRRHRRDRVRARRAGSTAP